MTGFGLAFEVSQVAAAEMASGDASKSGLAGQSAQLDHGALIVPALSVGPDEEPGLGAEALDQLPGALACGADQRHHARDVLRHHPRVLASKDSPEIPDHGLVLEAGRFPVLPHSCPTPGGLAVGLPSGA